MQRSGSRGRKASIIGIEKSQVESTKGMSRPNSLNPKPCWVQAFSVGLQIESLKATSSTNAHVIWGLILVESPLDRQNMELPNTRRFLYTPYSIYQRGAMCSWCVQGINLEDFPLGFSV